MMDSSSAIQNSRVVMSNRGRGLANLPSLETMARELTLLNVV